MAKQLQNRVGILLRASRYCFHYSETKDTFVRASNGLKPNTYEIEICPPSKIVSATKSRVRLKSKSYYDVSADRILAELKDNYNPHKHERFLVNLDGKRI